MFARIKKSGKYQYLQIVENRKENKKVKQRVIATIGRMDRLQEKDRVQTLIRSLSRFSEKALLILSGQSDLSAEAVKIGPAIIFERLWKETGIQWAIKKVLKGRQKGATPFCPRCNKGHRPNLKQRVVGVVIDDKGKRFAIRFGINFIRSAPL